MKKKSPLIMILILIIIIVMGIYLYRKVDGFGSTSPGTLVQLASTSVSEEEEDAAQIEAEIKRMTE